LAKILGEKSADEAAEQITGLEKSSFVPKDCGDYQGAGGKETYKGFLKEGGGDYASFKALRT
jgi:hypothetical protein